MWQQLICHKFHTESGLAVAEAKISGNVMGTARVWSSVDTSNAVSKHWTATDKQHDCVTEPGKTQTKKLSGDERNIMN